MQSASGDVALWAGLRAMQEKEAILRRLAEDQATDQPNLHAAALLEADALAEFIQTMPSVVIDVPEQLAIFTVA